MVHSEIVRLQMYTVAVMRLGLVRLGLVIAMRWFS